MPESSRHPLFLLVDEVARLNGRFRAAFAEARRRVDLGETELLVLTAIVEAQRRPTASQIGRSLGVPRQLVQRAANALIDAGLIAAADNPDHKRAALLMATARGRETKARADAVADEIAAHFAGLDRAATAAAAQALRGIRYEIEAALNSDAIK